MSPMSARDKACDAAYVVHRMPNVRFGNVRDNHDNRSNQREFLLVQEVYEGHRDSDRRLLRTPREIENDVQVIWEEKESRSCIQVLRYVDTVER